MSLVDIRVELPTHSKSFVVQVPPSCSILEVKQEIWRACPGQPRVDGQKLIWRGRYLANHEKVEEIWKSRDEPRIIHLAVHPSAWTSHAPEVPQPARSIPIPTPTIPTPTIPPQMANPQYHTQHRSQPRSTHSQPRSTHSQSSPPHPLAYVVFLHQNALLALEGRPIHSLNNVENVDALRHAAIRFTENNGWSWPALLDDRFPEATVGGLRYELKQINAQWYLSLVNPAEKPTPIQAHALKILSCTFTILSTHSNQVTIPGPLPTSNAIPIPVHMPPVPTVNEMLQQLGVEELRVANQNRNPNPIFPELREMPLRPLLAPMAMLVFRTLLLLYFVAPARKPIFGILLLAWMLYEIWQPIRNGLRGLRRAAEQQQALHNPVGPGEQRQGEQRQDQNPEQPNAPAAPAPRAPVNGRAPGGAPGARLENQMTTLLDAFGDMNIEAEERILNQLPGTPDTEPGLGQKAMSFLGLLVTTIHPAVWNRRRIALRRREGVIRTEANMRNTAPPVLPEGEELGPGEENAERVRRDLREQYARRPLWVRRYMDRVVDNEWVDDTD